MILTAIDRNRHPRVRVGFTLVELLVVIVILAVLIGLLLPAINAALRTAKNAAVTSEINQFAQALASFKSQYGVYPPSRLFVSESGDYSPAYVQSSLSSLSLSLQAATIISQRSVSYLRRIWPRMVVSTTGPVATSDTTLMYDFDGNGVWSKPQLIQGSECLVFFLGGLPGYVDGSTTPNVVTGFAKNPQNPMVSNNPAYGGTSNRSTSTFEFRPGRFVDVDTNNFPEYLDNLGGANPRFFVYFSAYEGQGYDPDDNNYIDDPLNDNNNPIYGGFMAPNAATPVTYVTGRPDIIASAAPNPYTASLPLPVDSSGNLNTSDTTPRDYINKNTFQIFSAGIDNLFGIGGAYQTNNTVMPLTFPASANSTATNGQTLSASIRSDRETDNLSNFTTGKMN